MPDLPDQIAVIADVHGNVDALRVVLSDIEARGISMVINLGDHLSGPLAAAETAEVIRNSDMLCIRGNHDRYLYEQARDEMSLTDAATFDQINADDLEWLRSLPATLTLESQIFACHGTPTSDTGYWLETVTPDGGMTLRAKAEVVADAVWTTAPVMLCAHTHLPRVVHLPDGRQIINPGSVGLQAYDDEHPVYHVSQTGSPEARYAILNRTKDSWKPMMLSLPYDAGRMIAMAKDGKRDEWAEALRSGWLR